VRHASNSTLMASQIRETVDSDSAASDPRASARVASTSRTERPRTKLAITRDSRALVRHTPVPSRRDANASSVSRSFGRSRVIGPDVVLTVVAPCPLRLPSRERSPRT
jgi:hypothetical protein